MSPKPKYKTGDILTAKGSRGHDQVEVVVVWIDSSNVVRYGLKHPNGHIASRISEENVDQLYYLDLSHPRAKAGVHPLVGIQKILAEEQSKGRSNRPASGAKALVIGVTHSVDEHGNLRAIDVGNGCDHKFETYHGFTESYRYCTKCDHKEGL